MLALRLPKSAENSEVYYSIYWEGSTLVVGQSGSQRYISDRVMWRGQPIKGRGYVEMTDYAGR